MRRLALAALAFAAALALGQGCSFTTATGFTECAADVECGAASACSSGYCLPMPAGCRRDESSAFEVGGRIPVAALLPLTDQGVRDLSEEQGLNAFRLAVAEANQGGGISSRPFGLFVCDIGANDAGLEPQLEWMVQNVRAPAVLISGSAATFVAAKNAVRRDAGTFIISPTATSDALTTSHALEGNVWRVSPPDTFQAKVVINLVRQDLPPNSLPDGGTPVIGVLHVDGLYGDYFGVPLAEMLNSEGFRSVRKPIKRNDLTGQTTAVNELSNDQPNASVIIGFPPEVRNIISVSRSRPSMQRAAGHRWYLTDAAKDPNSLTGTSVELEGTLGTAPAQGAGGAFNAFRDGFRTRYQIDPNSLSYTSHSYDSMWVVMLAAAGAAQGGAAITGPGMQAAMARLVATAQVPLPLRADKWVEASTLLAGGTSINIEGASGKLDFDLDAGVPVAPYEVWQVRDGGIGFVRFLDP